MVTLQRARVQWSGFPGAPGISTFYFLDAPAAQGPLDDLVQFMVTACPADVTLQVETAGDEIDSATGVLTGAWLGSAHIAHNGTGITGYAGPVGYQFQWLSAIVSNGRRSHGSTFVVPCVSDLFQNDGTILDASVNDIVAAGGAFIAAVTGNLQLWRRPRAATPQWTDVQGRVHPAVAARAGVAVGVDAVRVPDKAVVLRSRRD